MRINYEARRQALRETLPLTLLNTFTLAYGEEVLLDQTDHFVCPQQCKLLAHSISSYLKLVSAHSEKRIHCSRYL